MAGFNTLIRPEPQISLSNTGSDRQNFYFEVKIHNENQKNGNHRAKNSPAIH